MRCAGCSVCVENCPTGCLTLTPPKHHGDIRTIAALTDAGFYSLPRLQTLKAEAKGAVSHEVAIGDGWLIGAEVAGYLGHGTRKVLAIQPFGCMANHVAGRGIYASIQRKRGGAVVSADVDASGTPVNVYNRARMLIDLSETLL